MTKKIVTMRTLWSIVTFSSNFRTGQSDAEKLLHRFFSGYDEFILNCILHIYPFQLTRFIPEIRW